MDWLKKLSTERVLQSCEEEGQYPKKGINSYNKLLGPLMKVCGKALKVTVEEGTSSKVIFVNKKSAENFFSRPATSAPTELPQQSIFNGVGKALLQIEKQKVSSCDSSLYLGIQKLQNCADVDYKKALRLIKEYQSEGSALQKAVLAHKGVALDRDIIACILQGGKGLNGLWPSSHRNAAAKILLTYQYNELNALGHQRSDVDDILYLSIKDVLDGGEEITEQRWTQFQELQKQLSQKSELCADDHKIVAQKRYDVLERSDAVPELVNTLNNNVSSEAMQTLQQYHAVLSGWRSASGVSCSAVTEALKMTRRCMNNLVETSNIPEVLKQVQPLVDYINSKPVEQYTIMSQQVANLNDTPFNKLLKTHATDYEEKIAESETLADLQTHVQEFNNNVPKMLDGSGYNELQAHMKEGLQASNPQPIPLTVPSWALAMYKQLCTEQTTHQKSVDTFFSALATLSVDDARTRYNALAAQKQDLTYRVNQMNAIILKLNCLQETRYILQQQIESRQLVADVVQPTMAAIHSCFASSTLEAFNDNYKKFKNAGGETTVRNLNHTQ